MLLVVRASITAIFLVVEMLSLNQLQFDCSVIYLCDD
jgi:hypothetical protein